MSPCIEALGTEICLSLLQSGGVLAVLLGAVAVAARVALAWLRQVVLRAALRHVALFALGSGALGIEWFSPEGLIGFVSSYLQPLPF
ncbi:hypothetical protein [Haloarcula sp. CGMCC 1.2071]|uniref:hypothetical protein n=1 Tax=Haloarcula sp. CGMCC 1.2071 TaxID=3111454 RepID=UPI00300EA41E